MARRALYAVLSAKARDNEIIILDDLKFEKPKTKLGAELFGKLSKIKEFKNLQNGNGALVALSGKDDAVRSTLRNLPYAEVEEARNLNAYKVLKFKYIIFPQDGLTVFK